MAGAVCLVLAAAFQPAPRVLEPGGLPAASHERVSYPVAAGGAESSLVEQTVAARCGLDGNAWHGSDLGDSIFTRGTKRTLIYGVTEDGRLVVDQRGAQGAQHRTLMQYDAADGICAEQSNTTCVALRPGAPPAGALSPALRACYTSQCVLTDDPAKYFPYTLYESMLAGGLPALRCAAQENRRAKVVNIGHGTGALTGFLQAFLQGLDVTSVDISAAPFEMAPCFGYFDKSWAEVQRDGREYLEGLAEESVDLILMDAFDGRPESDPSGIPACLRTAGMFEAAYRALRPGGRFALNSHSTDVFASFPRQAALAQAGRSPGMGNAIGLLGRAGGCPQGPVPWKGGPFDDLLARWTEGAEFTDVQFGEAPFTDAASGCEARELEMRLSRERERAEAAEAKLAAQVASAEEAEAGRAEQRDADIVRRLDDLQTSQARDAARGAESEAARAQALARYQSQQADAAQSAARRIGALELQLGALTQHAHYLLVALGAAVCAVFCLLSSKLSSQRVAK